MVIHGLNKLTLVDYPEHMAAIVFTGSCNFRCPFCHNASLVLHPETEPVIEEDEVLAFLDKRKGMLDGVVFTGGEPLLNKDLGTFIEKVKKLGYLVKLDTNGFFPDRLEYLIDSALLDYVAMDVKNDIDSYGISVGIPALDTAPIIKSIELLKQGRVDYEFRTTVVKELHNLENFRKIVKLIAPCKRYFLQSFVKSKDIIGENLSSVDSPTMENYLNYIRNYITSTYIRDSM